MSNNIILESLETVYIYIYILCYIKKIIVLKGNKSVYTCQQYNGEISLLNREQLKNSALICDTKNKENIDEKNAKSINTLNGNIGRITKGENKIKRIVYLAKILKRRIGKVFLLNKLSFLCVKDKYA